MEDTMEPDVRMEGLLNLIEVEMDGLRATFRDTKRGLVFVRSLSGKIDARVHDAHESWIPPGIYHKMYRAALQALRGKKIEPELTHAQLILPFQ